MQRKSPRRRKKVERLTYASRGDQLNGSMGEQSKGSSVVETRSRGEKTKNDDIETAFSSFGARVIALSLVFSVFASECTLSYTMNVEPIVYALLLLWYFTLVTMGLFWIPNSKKYYVVCCINCVLLLGIPRLEAFRTLPPICGIIAAAAVICVCRALTVMSNPDQFASWSNFRHLYYFCVFGWHDFRSIRKVDKSNRKTLIRTLMWGQMRGGVMALVGIFLLGTTGQPTLSDLEFSSVLRLIIQVLARGFFGAYTFFNAFVSLDNGMRMQYVQFLGIDVDSAFGTIVPRKKLSALSEFARKCTCVYIHSSTSPWKSPSHSPSHSPYQLTQKTFQSRRIVIRLQ